MNEDYSIQDKDTRQETDTESQIAKYFCKNVPCH